MSYNSKIDCKNRSLITIILVFLITSFAFAVLVIQNFSTPLDGVVDIFWGEYPGYYLAKNITFTPFPQLNLINDQSFYPYGTNNVFSPWGFERDIFYAIFSSFLGLGPWLQIYYLISLVITAIGTFVLLYRDYGIVRAGGIGIIVTFADFYAIKMYPVQMAYSVLHWTVLSIITDFIIVKQVFLKQPISLRLILFRIGLLFLVLGQDLGYIAGYALMSFTISVLYISLLLGYRLFQKEINLKRSILSALIRYQQEIARQPLQIFLLIMLSILAACIYLPLAWQIAKEAKSFDFSKVINNGSWWSNPIRLIIPYLPGLNLVNFPIERILRERIVSVQVDGRPGLFLLILGGLGLGHSRKKIGIYIPLLAMFILCIVYHPEVFPTLKLFPWFAFNRVASRSTVIYPVILGLFALGINFNYIPLRRRKITSIFLVLLACFELYTAYSLPAFERDYPTFLFKNKNQFFSYMNYIKQQPGEAVLDWPFCVTGGNGIGSMQGICPYFGQNSGIFSLKKYHDKKVVGQYYGRLHPSQIKPFIEAGWYKLFSPGEGDSFTKRQSRCFYTDEWSFFTDFYKYNDFAGINLYIELLPESCVVEFHQRFGSSVAETEVPGAGRVQFIPKTPELRQQVNLALARGLKYNKISELDLIRNKVYDRMTTSEHNVSLTGLSKIEKQQQGNSFPGDLGLRWRWGLESETTIRFNLSEIQPLELTFGLVNLIEGQNISVNINGASVKKIEYLKSGEQIQQTFRFEGVIGVNTISLKYGDWNKPETSSMNYLNKPITVAFTELKISAK